MAGRPLTLGTAGHIDHGKTALVRALTGHQTDRLPEEKSRGISIELGYARLTLPGGRAVSVVDVPGHERFVRTMVAGATGIDLFLMCVAADDGVMPQTREHLAVLRQLGVSAGVVAITKADLGEPQLAAEEVAELMPGTPTVPVSAVTGKGIDELLAALDRVAAALPGRAVDGRPAQLHVDRSFTLRGIGTVVTGTLWSGRLAGGDSVRVLPQGLAARIRSVQVHEQPVESAEAGQRVALNLTGPSWREVGRGDVVCGEGSELAPTHRIDAAVSLEAGARRLGKGARVHVHHGTREAPARVYPLEGESLQGQQSGYAQLRLERPLITAPGDRLVLRQLAPPDTVGGGVVIDPSPRRHGPGPAVVRRLRSLERGEPAPEDPPARAAAGERPASAPSAVPAAPSLDRAALKLAELLEADGREPRADGELARACDLSSAEAGQRLRDLERAGRAVRVAANLHFAPRPLEQVQAEIVGICEREGAATVAGVRDALGTSRRYAQAVLEHLDRTKVTRRAGDAHVLRRRG